MMNDISTSGIEIRLHSAEEQCPINYWVSHLKNLAISIVVKSHLSRYRGKKYQAECFWEVLILHVLMDLPIDEVSNQLNDQYLMQLNQSRRKKYEPRHFQGLIPRTERFVPNGDQVRKYRNTLPHWIISDLNAYVFDAQLAYARANRLIGDELCVIVDNNDMWYYGQDRYPKNPFINKGNNGPGTSYRRKYCTVMIRSKSTSLYVGVDLIKKGMSETPSIIKCIDRLILKGYQLEYVMGDRWFPTYELLAELNARSIAYIGPYKKWRGIKKNLVEYLENGGKYIRPYTIKGAPANFYHSPQINTTIIFNNRRDRRLREIRTDYLKNKTSLPDRMKEIMVFLTTFPPMHGRKRSQGWATGICRKYRQRWQIESGFRDVNRMSPPSNARTNTRKYFMRSIQYWIYNAWQLERAKRQQSRFPFKSWRKGPTLRHFSSLQVRMSTASKIH